MIEIFLELNKINIGVIPEGNSGGGGILEKSGDFQEILSGAFDVPALNNKF